MSGGEVKDKDIRNLRGLTWLNDEIITFYAVMINARNKVVHDPEYDGRLCGPASDFCKAWSFTSFFWLKYHEGGYTGIKRWTKRVRFLLGLEVRGEGAERTHAGRHLRARRGDRADQ